MSNPVVLVGGWYGIVIADDPLKLSAEVNKLIHTDGWKPTGGVVVRVLGQAIDYMQAIYRERA